MNSFFNARKLALIAAAIPLFFTNQSYADDDDPTFIIAGPAAVPEYMGSEDYMAVPMIVSRFDAWNAPVEIEGLTGRVALINKPNWRSGIAFNFDFGRDDGVKNHQVAQLSEIDSAINMGGYLSNYHTNLFMDGDELELRASIFSDVSNTHDGLFGVATATYSLPLMLPFKIDLEIESTFANSDYMQTYFGVTQENALASQLAPYSAASGIRDVSFNTNIGFFTSPKWGSFLRVGVTRFMSDAKDSPIVKTGKQTQYFVGLGVFYRFGQ